LTFVSPELWLSPCTLIGVQKGMFGDLRNMLLPERLSLIQIQVSEYIPIHPGVKVSGRHRSTSCARGVVIQNVNNGDLRLTVALHARPEETGNI